MNTSALELTDVVYRWRRDAPPVLELTRLHIGRGERVFLSGPSGSGKSTLLGLLGGVLVPERGKVVVNDIELGTLGVAARDRFRVDTIGFIFQQFNLVPYLSVIDNVLLPTRFSARRKARAGANPEAEARRLLAALGLEALGTRNVTALSVGQQQRVAAARALLGKPELIIADEPTSSIDAALQDQFIALLLDECKRSGATVIFVSHDHRLAAHFTCTIDLESINRAR